jgi:hypothetical protein
MKTCNVWNCGLSGFHKYCLWLKASSLVVLLCDYHFEYAEMLIQGEDGKLIDVKFPK